MLRLTGVLILLLEKLLNLVTNIAIRNLDIVLCGAVLGHEVEETVVDVDLVFRIIWKVDVRNDV